ncbi:MAG: hypothetical protein ABIO63_02180 [Casimicrobiaceae bacterium]
MSIKTEVTMGCDKNGCKNSVVAGSRKLVKKEARSQGWLVKGTKSTLCKTHRPVAAVSAKKEKKVVKKVAGKKGKSAPTKKQGLVSKVVRGVVNFTSGEEGTDKPN